MGKRFIRNKKGKGTLAENELIHKFWETNLWVCVRVAGSGATKYPSPDLLASRGDKKIVMEVKVVNGVKKYFTGQEIRDLNYFAEKFGAEAWVGIKFQENQWFFITSNELDVSKNKNYSISLIDMKRKGFSFEEMIE
ncbi:MAG: Holliday junction resolvase [Nanoarchaeota archaeon]|nr:Holliday junction resolvase [Nanoarchaeota archaeon]MCA9497369.1 Holliday junction resolvase [Nanoarchaeota archaeon]